MKFAFLFPGQGSQSVGMMAAYGDVVQATFAEASQALGMDLWDLVCNGPAETLNQTVHTQPAMLTAGVAVWRLWRQQGGAMPAFMAGHSLGEYTALVVAGALDFSECLPLVRLRAAAMQEAVPEGAGAMAAVMGLEAEALQAACREAANGEVVEAVNFNAPGQIVIAGHAAAVRRGVEAARARGAKRAVILPVSAPFHSSLMAPAAAKLRTALVSSRVRTPLVPVVHNVDAATHPDPDALRDALYRQADHPVRWSQCIQAMAEAGITHVFECGPGKVLAGLSRRICGELTGLALSDRQGLEEGLQMLRGIPPC